MLNRFSKVFEERFGASPAMAHFAAWVMLAAMLVLIASIGHCAIEN